MKKHYKTRHTLCNTTNGSTIIDYFEWAEAYTTPSPYRYGKETSCLASITWKFNTECIAQVYWKISKKNRRIWGASWMRAKNCFQYSKDQETSNCQSFNQDKLLYTIQGIIYKRYTQNVWKIQWVVNNINSICNVWDLTINLIQFYRNFNLI